MVCMAIISMLLQRGIGEGRPPAIVHVPAAWLATKAGLFDSRHLPPARPAAGTGRRIAVRLLQIRP